MSILILLKMTAEDTYFTLPSIWWLTLLFFFPLAFALLLCTGHLADADHRATGHMTVVWSPQPSGVRPRTGNSQRGDGRGQAPGLGGEEQAGRASWSSSCLNGPWGARRRAAQGRKGGEAQRAGGMVYRVTDCAPFKWPQIEHYRHTPI